MAEQPTGVKRMNWLWNIEPYERPSADTLVEIREDIRLKKILRRAVKREVAPQSLIEAIRAGIRA